MKHFSIFQKHKCRGNLNWYGRISENGRFRVVSLGTTKKSDAEMWLSKMNYEKFLPQPPEHSDATIIEACNKFLDKISIGNNISHRTLEAYTQELAHFKEWCNIHKFKYVSQINELDTIDFSASIISRFAPKTSREIIRCSKSMMDFACRAYKVGENPFEHTKLPRVPKTRKTFWTPEEINHILDNAPCRNYRKFWALMAFAGLRYFEAKKAKWGDITEDNIHVVGKGNIVASVPLSERLKKELGRRKADDDLIIPTATHISNTVSLRVLRKAVKSAGLNQADANNHKFRHSFASNLVRAGVNLKTVHELMRHRGNIEITMEVYSHLLPSDLKNAIDTIQ